MLLREEVGDAFKEQLDRIVEDGEIGILNKEVSWAHIYLLFIKR